MISTALSGVRSPFQSFPSGSQILMVPPVRNRWLDHFGPALSRDGRGHFRRNGMNNGKGSNGNGETKVAIYSRVSTGEQDTAMQVEELRRVVAQRGWTISAEYSDTISGSKEGLGRHGLMQDAHLGKFNHVLVWRFDRFARSAKDLLLALDTLSSLGIGFSSLRESFDTTSPVGRATLTILAAVAELERNIIKERVVAGLDRAKAKGRKLGRPERDVDVARVREMLSEGRTQRQISVALRIPRSTLRRALART